MSGYRKVSYYELCRLCTNSDGDKMSIFCDEGKRKQLYSKIQACLPIQILAEDSLPKVVCHDCVQKLDHMMEFRENVVNAESMLVSYFTSLRYSEDFFKEGKVYVKNTEKSTTSSATTNTSPFAKTTTAAAAAAASPTSPEEVDPIKIDKLSSDEHDIIDSHNHQQAVIVGSINTSNIQIISNVPSRGQPYKCAMQIQSSGVTEASVVESATESHYSFQQQSSLSSSSSSQSRINGQHSQQAQSVHQSQLERALTQQSGNEILSLQQRLQTSQFQSSQELQLCEFEKLQQIQQQLEKIPISRNQQDNQHKQIIQNNNNNNNTLLKNNSNSDNQISFIKSECNDINQTTDNNFTAEVLLDLGIKNSGLITRDYIKNVDDNLSGNSIGQISEFLRIKTESPLLTVNNDMIYQLNRDIVCCDCGKTFETANHLNSHECPNSLMMNDVSEVADNEGNNSKSGSFECDICNKTFKRKELWQQHQKVHTNERPFVCPICSKAFHRREHLHRHEFSHSGQKTHECELCGKTFSRKDNLHKHRKTHGVAGPYVCEHCGKSFVVKHYYLMHLNTHAPAGATDDPSQDPLPYKCDLCFKAFSVKQYLSTHKLRHRSKANAKQSQQQQQRQANQQPVQQITVSSPSNGGISITSNDATTNDQNGDSSAADIQNPLEQNDQSNSVTFVNQFPGNVQQQFQCD